MLLVGLHTIVILICLVEIIFALQDCHRRVIRLIVFSGIGLIHGLVPILTEPWQTRLNLPYEAHLEAAWFVVAGTLLLSLGANLASFFFHKPIANESATSFRILKSLEVQKPLRWFTVFAIAIGFITWVASVYFAGGTLLTATNEGRFALRGQGNTTLVTVALQFFALNYTAGFFAWFHHSKTFSSLSLAYTFGFSILIFFLSSGSRFAALAVVGGSLIGFLLSRTVSVKKLAAGFVLALILIFLTCVAIPLRHQMHNMSSKEIVQFVLSKDRLETLLTSDPLNYHDTCIQVLQAFPTQYDYVNAASYRRILFFPIPSSFAPILKPPDPNRKVAQALFGYEQAISIDWMHPPGLFGDLWINFWGWCSVTTFVAWGALLTVANYYLIWSPKVLLFLGPSLFATCILYLRGQPYTLGLNLLVSAVLITFLGQITGLRHALKKCSQRFLMNRSVYKVNFQQQAACRFINLSQFK